jgi:hypothetical protein
MVRAVTSPSRTGRNLIPRVALSVVVGLAVSALVLACGGSSDSGSGSADAGVDRRLPGPIHPAASCLVTIETPELIPGTHVPEGTVITYNSNPPSSGPHYPVWANFQEYSAPLDEGYLVHSLEHGAVALLYKCDPTTDACKPTIEALRKIRDAMPTDPTCDPSIRVRVVIAPFPKLDAPVGAVAWGITYKAECVDVPTLTAFAKDNYARATENICAPGRTF